MVKSLNTRHKSCHIFPISWNGLYILSHITSCVQHYPLRRRFPTEVTPDHYIDYFANYVSLDGPVCLSVPQLVDATNSPVFSRPSFVRLRPGMRHWSLQIIVLCQWSRLANQGAFVFRGFRSSLRSPFYVVPGIRSKYVALTSLLHVVHVLLARYVIFGVLLSQ